MPLYEYQCEDCGQVVEVIQKFSDPPLSICSECGARLHRLLSAPAIRFKGSGWYVTDYGNGKKDNRPQDSSSTGAQSNEKAATKESSTKDGASD